jgi:hypothetical protein
MIIVLLGLPAVLVLAAGAVIQLRIWRRENFRAELQADEDRLAEQRDQYVAMAMLHTHRPGGLGPSAVDPHDRVLI